MTEFEKSGLAKGLKQGREQGLQEMRQAITGILAHRFGKVPLKVEEALQSIAEFSRLRDLSVRAATNDSLLAFENLLEGGSSPES